MDLNVDAIHDVIHPTAIFSSTCTSNPETSKYGNELPSSDVAWENSRLNPKNRIDSLEPLDSPLWDIEGCSGLGTQFFAVPLFLQDAPPMRFDVFIAHEATEDPLLRELLDMDKVFHSKDASRVHRQAITSYIVRALQVWTMEKYGLDRAKEMYTTLPFGSRIIFENLPLDVHQVNICVAPMYNLEVQQLPVQSVGDGSLSAMWNMNLEDFPPQLDISQLAFVRQLQDSVCVVRYRNAGQNSNQGGEDVGDLWVLKALTSSVNYMYHELRTLLTMSPHQNVISRPVKLVTKPSRWNAKKVNVVGFLEEFHSGGSLRDHLPYLRIQGQLDLKHQIKWATQITSALCHTRYRGRTYYPDLRLDNIVLSSAGDAILVDFEQRGVWVEFASPEVNALQYMLVLATDESSNDNDDDDSFVMVNEKANAQSKYSAMLSRYLPDWEALVDREEYTNPPHGYNIPWLCLSPREQEAAEVYMLGRVLWCIFEGMSAPQRGAAWQSYRHEPEIEFPTYRLTPPELRRLIDRCTSGRRGHLSKLIARRGSKLVMRDDSRSPKNTTANGPEEEIRRVAKNWWTNEIKWAEEFLLNREKLKEEGVWHDNCFNRPSLRDVKADLRVFEMKALLAD